MDQAKGFTIVELVVVIALLGVLAAVALPRFINIGDDAREAVLEHLEGKMHSLANLVYAEAVLRSVQGQATNTAAVRIDGSIVDLHYGYPQAQATSASHLDMEDLLGVSVSGGLSATAVGSNRIRIGYDNTTNGCYVEYREPDASVSANGYQITRIEAGCN